MIPTPSSVLVVTPHPDDFEFGCAGIVAKWIKEGAKAVLVVATNGDKGTDDPEMTSENLAAIRREEQLEAGRVLGLSEVVFLDYPDGAWKIRRSSGVSWSGTFGFTSLKRYSRPIPSAGASTCTGTTAWRDR